MSTLVAILFLIAFLILAYQFIYAAKKYAPWFPARKRDFERIHQLSGLQSSQTFYELGCGTGRLTCFFARKGKKAKGIEMVYPLYFICLIRKAFVKPPKPGFKRGNFFKMDVSDADAIFLFGLPETISDELFEKLSRSCKKGTKVISYVFKFQNQIPAQVSKPTEKDLSIYVYEID